MIATLTAMLASALPWLVLGVGGLAAFFGYKAKVRADATKAEKQRVATADAVQVVKDVGTHQEVAKRMATAPDLELANELRRNLRRPPVV